MQRMRGPKRKKIRELLLEEVKIWLSFEKMSKRKNFWEGRSETRARTQRTWIRGQNKGWLRNYPNWNMLDSVRHIWESLGLYFEGPCWSKESWTWSFGRGGGGWLLRYFKQQNDMVILVIRETTLIAPMWEIYWRGTNGVLETYNLPRMNHEEIENLNRSITSKKTESIIWKLPTKSSGPQGFTGKFD